MNRMRWCSVFFWQAQLRPGSAPDDTVIHHSGRALFAVLSCQSALCPRLHPPDKHSFAVQTAMRPVWHHTDYLTPGAQTCMITNRLLTLHKRWLGTAHIGSNSSLIITHTYSTCSSCASWLLPLLRRLQIVQGFALLLHHKTWCH